MIDTLPKKARNAIALYMILEARYYDPVGFQVVFFTEINEATNKRRQDLYSELNERGYQWNGNRWMPQQ